MKRRALIIYCYNSPSGELKGPAYDNRNYQNFLHSKLGGEWYNGEMMSLPNPNSLQVVNSVRNFLANADYTFIIFSGHGFLNLDDNKRQYIELMDQSISIKNLITNASRQTIIIDACRGYYSPTQETLGRIDESYDTFSGDIYSTRELFNQAVMQAEEGITVLYAAKENRSALDTDNGGAYLLSLLKIAELWKQNNNKNNMLDLKQTHNYAKNYISEHFITNQEPTMNQEKRLRYYPFAVK